VVVLDVLVLVEVDGLVVVAIGKETVLVVVEVLVI
jgi:hypothetical protein